MADENEGTAKSMGETMQEKIVDPLRSAGEALKGAGQKAAENGASLSMAVLDHAEANVREAFAALRSAAKASSLAEAMKVQGDYVRDQGARGMAQAREIGEMISKFGKDAAAGFSKDK